ncbi:hypothetical protein BJY04DRAFT_219120 [Aspergillus karnatakaensis]|uniref:uncharacterized protein n=1 Tax=Aspergillus karnatakaensis TaxID=1810916 RepID=UPI003CCCB162
MAGFTSYHLQDLTFTGPQGAKQRPYASVAILDPIITIERLHGKYHIAARFNIETAILDYASRDSDDRDVFFQSICLQYRSPHAGESLFMKPESDPSAALTVSRGFTSSTSATVGATLSQTPSGNVSLGLTRSRSLTVEYPMTSWSLSAHRVVSGDDEPGSREPVRYQWFWAGTQDESRRLSTDLKHAVKRHVVVKRIVSENMIAALAEDNPDSRTANGGEATSSKLPQGKGKQAEEEGEEDDGEEGAENRQTRTRKVKDTRRLEPNPQTKKPAVHTKGKDDTTPKPEPIYTWEALLDFSFSVQIRVKRRLSRLHRLALLSSNEVRGRTLRPTYTENFRFRVPPLAEMIPACDTSDIAALLNDIKKEYEGRLDELPEKDFLELASAHVQREQTVRTTQSSQRHTSQGDQKLKLVAPRRNRHYLRQVGYS